MLHKKRIIDVVKSIIITIERYPEARDNCLINGNIESFERNELICSNDYKISLFYDKRRGIVIKDRPEKGNIKIFIGGDVCEFEIDKNEFMANSFLITIDYNGQSLEILTSITGLPPLYMYETDKLKIISSDIILIKSIKGTELEFDQRGVIDLCKIGHPIKHRTLFKNIRLLPGGHRVYWSNKGLLVQNVWRYTDRQFEGANLEIITNKQIEVFLESVNKIEEDKAFLSLTGGIDTRTILSSFILLKKRFPECYTISGANKSLDAQLSEKLCKKYNINHNIVTLDAKYYRNIELYAERASKLSGGIASIDQAHEVYYYEQIGNETPYRISGHLGNQIGRGGTEGVSIRNGDLKIIKSDYLLGIQDLDIKGHWIAEVQENYPTHGFISLLQYENMHSSLGNYCIGNSYCVQNSPYAYKKLIELSIVLHNLNKRRVLDPKRVMINDLLHRFIGDNETVSFQRKLIKRCAGYVAECPINWGWKASGGVSATGLIKGLMSLIDITSNKYAYRSKITRHLLDKCNIPGQHIFHDNGYWIKKNCKSIVYDLLTQDSLKSIFEQRTLSDTLKEFFSNKEAGNSGTIYFAIDLAFANINFQK